MGRPGRLEQISTLKTEVVSVRDMTQTQVLIVNLIIPPDITVRDASDKPVTTIKLRIEIQKTEPEPTPKATPTPARPPEKKNQRGGIAEDLIATGSPLLDFGDLNHIQTPSMINSPANILVSASSESRLMTSAMKNEVTADATAADQKSGH